LPQLLWLSELHFPLYRRPVDAKEIEFDNVRALYRQIERPLKQSLDNLHLKEANCSKT